MNDVVLMKEHEGMRHLLQRFQGRPCIPVHSVVVNGAMQPARAGAQKFEAQCNVASLRIYYIELFA